MDLHEYSPGVLLDERELAAAIHVSARKLQYWRQRDEGPPFVRLGRHVRYRALDGGYHSLEATAPTPAEAEQLLRAKAAGARDGVWLSPDSTVEQLARWWLAGLRSRGRKLQSGTVENDDFDSRHVVRAMGRLRLREFEVRVVDAVTLELEQRDPANAKRVHATLRRMADEAVRLGVTLIGSADPLDQNTATSQPPNPDRPGSRGTSHGPCCDRVEWVVQGDAGASTRRAERWF